MMRAVWDVCLSVALWVAKLWSLLGSLHGVLDWIVYDTPVAMFVGLNMVANVLPVHSVQLAFLSSIWEQPGNKLQPFPLAHPPPQTLFFCRL